MLSKYNLGLPITISEITNPNEEKSFWCALCYRRSYK